MSVQLTKTNASDYGIKVTHKGDGGWPQALSDLIGGHPATMAKTLKATADGWLLFVNPNNATASNASHWAGRTKNFISIFETFAFGQKFYVAVDKVIPKPLKSGEAAKDPKPMESLKNGLDIGVNGALTLSEAANSYVTLAKVGVFFAGSAASIAAAKLFHELTGGISAVLGTIKSYIVIGEGKEKLKTMEESTSKTKLQETQIKAQKLNILSEQIFGIKNINYVAFGIITVLGLIAPALIIPASVIWLLTVGTIVETVTKHFVDTKMKHLQPTMNEAALKYIDLEIKA